MCLFVNMLNTKENKILCISQRVSHEKLKCQQRLQVVAIAMGYWLVDRRFGNGRWRSAHIDLVDELVLHKNGQSRNNNYLHTVVNNMTLLFTKYYQNWLISVENIASQSSVIFEPNWKDPFSGFMIPKVVQRH